MKIATFKWTILPDVAITYIANGQTPEVEFKRFCEKLKTSGVRGFLAGVGGQVEANSVQRKMVADASKDIPIAVITDERLVRGLVTAVSWLGVQCKAFAWADLRDAVTFLKLTDTEMTIKTTLMNMKDECDRIERLRSAGYRA